MSVKHSDKYFKGRTDKNKDSNPQKVFDTYDDVMESVGEKLDDYSKKISDLRKDSVNLDKKALRRLRAYKINSKALGRVEGGLDNIISEIATCERLVPLYKRDFEENKNKAGWFNLNSIGAFLFPKDVFFFKKPGFQFATLTVLLIFVINIGINFTDKPQNELAINTTSEKSEQNEVGNQKFVEEKSIEEVAKIVEEIRADNDIEQVLPATPSPELIEVASLDVLADEIVEYDKEEEVQKELPSPVVVQDASGREKAFVESKKIAKMDASTAENNTKLFFEDVGLSNNIISDSTVVTLNEVITTTTTNVREVTSLKKMKDLKVNFKSSSQSLKSSEDVIDLLFVAM